MKARVQQKTGLDFVVCGMPRGGTTFFGQLFNVHPDVYCYFMETGLFRELATFAGERPLPLENLPLLEQWLRTDMHTTLVAGTEEARVQTFRRLLKYREMMCAHGLDEASGPGIRAWDPLSFETWVQDLLGLFRAGLYGSTLYAEAMQLLARYLRRVTTRSLLGEKTPGNLFHLDVMHEADPALKVFCIVREPYSTIESMKRRAMRNAGFGDSAFSAEVLGGITDYYRYLRPAHEFALRAPPGVFHAHRYEDLVRDPVSVMAHVYAQLGLDMPEVAQRVLPHLSLPTDSRHIQDLGLTVAEHRLIEMVAAPMLHGFGYAEMVRETRGEATFEERVLPLSGFHLAHGAPLQDVWMGRRGDLFVLHRGDRSALLLEMGLRVPSVLGLDMVTLDVEVDDEVVQTLRLTSVEPWFSVEVPLAPIASRHAGGDVFGVRVVLRASVSWTPVSIPGEGPDLRDMAMLLRSARLA